MSRSTVCDQDGRVAPTDLVVLDFEPAELSAQELRAIDALDWYRPAIEEHPRFATVLLVSFEALARCVNGLFDGTTPDVIGLSELSGVERIMPVLHRWGARGFYHA